MISNTSSIVRTRRKSHPHRLLLPSSTRADLQFDVFLGYGEGQTGILKQSDWFPVSCEIFNDGPTFTGVISVHPQLNRSSIRQLTVELPTNTRKRIHLPVFSSQSNFGTWQVTFANAANACDMRAQIDMA